MSTSNIDRATQIANRVAEIRDRTRASADQIRNGAVLDGNKLSVRIEFKDEQELVEKWMQAVADCNSLLAIMDGVNPI